MSGKKSKALRSLARGLRVGKPDVPNKLAMINPIEKFYKDHKGTYSIKTGQAAYIPDSPKRLLRSIKKAFGV